MGVVLTDSVSLLHVRANQSLVPLTLPAQTSEGGEKMLSSMVSIPLDEFWLTVWEQRPAHVAGRPADYFASLFALADFDELVVNGASVYSGEDVGVPDKRVPMRNHLDLSLLVPNKNAQGDMMISKWGNRDSEVSSLALVAAAPQPWLNGRPYEVEHEALIFTLTQC